MRQVGSPDLTALSTARVAVVSTNLTVDRNDLWHAAKAYTRSLIVLGAQRSAAGARPDDATFGLREIDLGKGLIWRHLVGVRRMIRRFQPDLLHVCGELWGVTAQELCGLPCPVVVHGAENVWEHGRGVERVLRRRLVDRAVRSISGYASWNAAGRDHIAACAPSLPVLVLPAVIPPEPFRSTSWRPAAQADPRPFEILVVGRLVHQKGFDILLDAVGIMPESRDVVVTICGAGDAEQELLRRAEHLGVRANALGALTPNALAERMSRADVLVQPSRSTPNLVEQFGRSVAEAMTVGLPCLVSSSGELPNVVGGDQSAIFSECQPKELAARLSRLVRDRSLLVDLSQRQHLLAARYSPQDASAQLARFWEDVLAGQR